LSDQLDVDAIVHRLETEQTVADWQHMPMKCAANAVELLHEVGDKIGQFSGVADEVLATNQDRTS
jgi:hypothetical protein